MVLALYVLRRLYTYIAKIRYYSVSCVQLSLFAVHFSFDEFKITKVHYACIMHYDLNLTSDKF
jgi:hypothetical protein